MRVPHLYLDFETYCDLDIKEVGVYRYVRQCEPLLLSVARDDETVLTHVFDDGAQPDAADLCWTAYKQGWTFVAHNAQFERLVLREALGVNVPPEQWRCTASLARSLALPGKLALVEEVIERPHAERKLGDGTELVRLFCMPHKPTKARPYARYDHRTHPEEWQRFIAYSRQDVASCRWLHRHLPDWNQDAQERRVYALDQEVNDRGLPLDVGAVEQLYWLTETVQATLNLSTALATGGAVGKASEVAQLLKWLATECGVRLPNLRRDTILRYLSTHPSASGPVRNVLLARLEGGKTAAKKYSTMLETETGGRLRGAYVYCGAGRTMRWSGQLVQTQNLYRPTVDPAVAVEAVCSGVDLNMLYDSQAEVAASAVRAVFAAPEGQHLVVGDFSQVEARIVAWLAAARVALERFASPDIDPYVETARDVGSTSRPLGKVLVLACGFGMGGARFRETAATYGVELSEADAEHYVTLWRDKNPEVRQLWWKTESAARMALQSPGRTYRYLRTDWKVEVVPGVGTFLTGKLPSGHRLCYYEPRIDRVSNRLTYRGLNSITHQWGVLETWGGKLVENAVQATARHLMAQAMLRIPPEIEVVGHTHDEVITLVKDAPEARLEQLLEIMRRTPDWAAGLPVGAGGYVSKRYRK